MQIVLLTCVLCALVPFTGCQLVVPSVRTGDVQPLGSCELAAGADGMAVESPFTGPAAPAVHPPHSKFHPVPTHPVFEPAAAVVAHLDPLSEPIPLPDPGEPADIEPHSADELPAPGEPDAPPTSETSESDEPENEDVLETNMQAKPKNKIQVRPASVEWQWIDEGGR